MTRSTAPDLTDALAFTEATVRRAGALLTASYERVERIDYKSARDVVTEVDYASEKLVIAAIRDRYPDDGILAEESGHHRRQNREAFAGRTWVVDPLDGTVNYANGIPYFCVSMALVDADGPLLGVILDPLRDDLYAATRGGPATLNGEPVRASEKEQLGDYVVSLAVIGRGGLGRERRIARSIRIHRRMGAAALALAYVANGALRRLRPERRALPVGRGRRRPDRRACGRNGQRPARWSVVGSHGPRRDDQHRGRPATAPRGAARAARRGGHPGPRPPALRPAPPQACCRTVANMASVRAVAPQTSWPSAR